MKMGPKVGSWRSCVVPFVIAALALLVAAFSPSGTLRPSLARTSLSNMGISPLYHNNGDNEGDESEKAAPFDMDFADAMSKPLPDWFLEENEEKEKMMQGIRQNRERIAAEFRAKYEVSEEEKIRERRVKEAKLQAREKAIKAKKKSRASFQIRYP